MLSSDPQSAVRKLTQMQLPGVWWCRRPAPHSETDTPGSSEVTLRVHTPPTGLRRSQPYRKQV